MRILYVEDERSMANVVSAMLRQVGYEFDNAYCGQEAIDLAMENSYDLILLDIMLPDLDGYEVIERLREAGIETPFLVQTGLLDRANENNGASFGVTEHLIKPFNKNELIKRIEKVAAHSNPGTPVARMLETGRLKAEGVFTAEKRENRRFNTLKSAEVVWPTPFSCVVLNMCYGGAAIRLPYPEKELPPKFGMVMGSGPEFRCEVCWRVGDKAGVKFI